MSYTNGIGSSQLLLTAVSTSSTAAASRVQNGGATEGAVGAGKTSGTEDHTTFSAAASLMAQPAGDSDVRMDKVAALQQAIAAGSYNVSASDIADKLMTVLAN